MLLQNKKAVVTGGGRGIGSTIARLFAAEGASVLVHYNKSKSEALSLAQEIGRGSIAAGADLSNPDEADHLIKSAIDEFGRVDILVNCASSFASGITVENATWTDYAREYDGVVGVTVNAVHAVLPHMKDQKSGRIVNFVATLVQRPAADLIVHTTAKSALIGYTRTLARAVGPFGITANMISPGMTLTEFSSSLPEETKQRVREITPLRRLAEPDDVARIALFYASDLAGMVTGANIAPDGGLAIL